MTFYAFIHFNMNTFTDAEWGEGRESPDTFNPTALDCRTWCELFSECGLSGVIITAKHHDGFCLWPSACTEHDVASSSWRDGRGDVIRELADACAEFDLKLGIYISPWDRNNPLYGVDDAAYNEYFRKQLRELLGNYGEVFEVWFDGANGDRDNPRKYQEYDWDGFVEVVRELQPGAVIFSDGGPDIRWVGNERGYAAPTQWATMDRDAFYPGYSGPRFGELNTGKEGGTHWLPAEVDVSIRPGWYYHAAEDDKVKSVEHLLKIYYESVGHSANLLLNFPVDRRGLVHENDAKALRAMTAILEETFAEDLARARQATASNVRGGAGDFAAANVTDGDPATSWATDDGVTESALTIEFGEPVTFDRIVLAEHIELGQRVRAFAISAPEGDGAGDGGKWREVFRGTTIGHRRIAAFDAITAAAVRLTIEDARACPVIESVEVYASSPRDRYRPE
jgi:alpha-L-fucosidase